MYSRGDSTAKRLGVRVYKLDTIMTIWTFSIDRQQRTEGLSRICPTEHNRVVGLFEYSPHLPGTYRSISTNLFRSVRASLRSRSRSRSRSLSLSRRSSLCLGL